MAWTTMPEWPHGRVWKGKSGRTHFYVSRGGKDHATGATTVAGALAALERFERTGDARQPEDAGPVALEDTGDGLAAEFLGHLRAKGDSIEWRRNVRQHLAWWATQLRGRDLRAGRRDAVTITDIRRALDGATSAPQREAVLRALYSYLRGADRIATAEDPLYGKPRIAPPSRPAQSAIDKSMSADAVETVRKHLEEEYLRSGRTGRRWADLIAVLEGTGMHVRELRRFADAGTVEALPDNRKPSADEAGVLVIPLHKSGAPYRVAVSAATLETARRVRAAGSFSEAVFYSVLRKASEKTGAKVLPGRFRHTVAKLAVNAGASMQAVGDYLGHKSPATTRKFYATLGVPAKVPTRR